MEYLLQAVDFFLHLDKYLDQLIAFAGPWTYVALFAIIFCETGLVVTPFLPGDSLLFAVGAFCALGSLDLGLSMLLLFVAAVLGDAVNYHIGQFLGPKVFERPHSRIFRKEYLEKTQGFYHRYGGKTVIIARFVPIVRTFAPFLAGMGTMKYSRFLTFNVLGAALWVGLILPAGFIFGQVPIVKQNFSLVVFGIIGVSLLPAVYEIWHARSGSSKLRVARNGDDAAERQSSKVRPS